MLRMSSETPHLSHQTDLVFPFLLEVGQLRGRFVRLGPALSAILARHAYPPAVAALLAEAAVLACLLAHGLKFKGVFTLQASGHGAVRMLVVDVTTEGAIRAYATMDAEAVGDKAGMALLGDGHLAFTIDQGDAKDRYQGIVALQGETLSECVQHYLKQSEQITTGIMIATSFGDPSRRDASAAGLLLQKLPDPQTEEAGSGEEDEWRHAMVLMSSCTPEEMLDPALPAETLLYRLFHAERARGFSPHALIDRCRCSAERVETVLRSLPEDEVRSLKIDGAVEVKCEFCARLYRYDDSALERLYKLEKEPA